MIYKLGKTNLTENVDPANTVKVEINTPGTNGTDSVQSLSSNINLGGSNPSALIQTIIIRSLKIVDGVKIPVIETKDTLNVSFATRSLQTG
jgi:hypothetical protein